MREAYINTATRVYILFYAALASSVILITLSQTLVLIEAEYDSATAHDLEIISVCITAVNTMFLQMLSIVEAKAIAGRLHKVGRLLDVYLNPLTPIATRNSVGVTIVELTMAVETFWVRLPTIQASDLFPRLLTGGVANTAPTETRANAVSGPAPTLRP